MEITKVFLVFFLTKIVRGFLKAHKKIPKTKIDFNYCKYAQGILHYSILYSRQQQYIALIKNDFRSISVTSTEIKIVINFHNYFNFKLLYTKYSIYIKIKF